MSETLTMSPFSDDFGLSGSRGKQVTEMKLFTKIEMKTIIREMDGKIKQFILEKL